MIDPDRVAFGARNTSIEAPPSQWLGGSGPEGRDGRSRHAGCHAPPLADRACDRGHSGRRGHRARTGSQAGVHGRRAAMSVQVASPCPSAVPGSITASSGLASIYSRAIYAPPVINQRGKADVPLPAPGDGSNLGHTGARYGGGQGLGNRRVGGLHSIACQPGDGSASPLRKHKPEWVFAPIAGCVPEVQAGGAAIPGSTAARAETAGKWLICGHQRRAAPGPGSGSAAAVQRDGLARAYQSGQQLYTAPLEVVGRATSASSDRVSRLQLFGLIGLVAGLAVGAVLATVQANSGSSADRLSAVIGADRIAASTAWAAAGFVLAIALAAAGASAAGGDKQIVTWAVAAAAVGAPARVLRLARRSGLHADRWPRAFAVRRQLGGHRDSGPAVAGSAALAGRSGRRDPARTGGQGQAEASHRGGSLGARRCGALCDVLSGGQRHAYGEGFVLQAVRDLRGAAVPGLPRRPAGVPHAQAAARASHRPRGPRRLTSGSPPFSRPPGWTRSCFRSTSSIRISASTEGVPVDRSPRRSPTASASTSALLPPGSR